MLRVTTDNERAATNEGKLGIAPEFAVPYKTPPRGSIRRTRVFRLLAALVSECRLATDVLRS